MSGQHALHLAFLPSCGLCHGATMDLGGGFSDKTRHIDGHADVKFESGTWDSDSKSCSVSCHNDEDKEWE